MQQIFEIDDDERKRLQNWLQGEFRRQEEKQNRRERLTILSICDDESVRKLIRDDDFGVSENSKIVDLSEVTEQPSKFLQEIKLPRQVSLEQIDEKEVKTYLRFLEKDRTISKFLKNDYCKMVADSYLLAEVYILFKRAKLQQFTRTNFFKLLYLANEMEEDEGEPRFNIYPWALGTSWQSNWPDFLVSKDELWKRMKFKSIVQLEDIQAVMEIEPGHPIWQRKRRMHHAGAVPTYMRKNTEGYCELKDAGQTPDPCSPCLKLLRTRSIPTGLLRRFKPYRI